MGGPGSFIFSLHIRSGDFMQKKSLGEEFGITGYPHEVPGFKLNVFILSIMGNVANEFG